MIFKYYQCTHCGITSPAGEWNTATLKKCGTMFLKKSFKKIQHAGKGPRAYHCPCCDKLMPRQLIIPLHESNKYSEAL